MDTFDYQRSSVPARLPSQRVTSLAPHRFDGHASESTPSPLSIRAVFRASRRYWWLILALWTVGSAGIGAGVYLKVRPMYRALSWLRVEPNIIDLYGGSTHEGAESFMQTHVALIKSPNVLSAAAVDEKVMAWPRIQAAGDAQQELGRMIQVAIQPGTRIIEVSMTSQSPDEAAVMVNAVVDKFLDANRGWASGASKDQIDKLTDYKTKLDTDINKTTEELRVRTARISKAPVLVARPQLDADGKPAKADPAAVDWDVNAYHQMLKECSAVKMELLTAEASLAEARAAATEMTREAAVVGNKPKTSSQVEYRLRSDPDLHQLQKQQLDAFNRAEKMKDDLRDHSDPALLAARKKVSVLSQNYQDLRARKRLQYQSELEAGPDDNNPESAVIRLTGIVKNLTIKRAALEAELSKTKLENSKAQSEELEIRFLEEERSAGVMMQQTVQKKLEQLQFESVGEERIRRVNEARPEGRPISDKRMQYMAMAPVGVFGAVLALVVLLEIRSGRVADTEVLASRMRHEVFSIAPLPSLRPGMIGDGDKSEQRLARFVQSLDHLRVALCEGGLNGEGRCVMITSATGGEGKTTLSAHLAARCANAGTSTLLIDADMRRASLGRLLDVPPGLGLGDLLAGHTDLDANLISVQAGGFHFLSAGTPGIDPTRVLKSTRLAELIGQFRQMYDLIIIDTPPVLPVADALIMGRWADGAVMAARYDASRLPLVERANRQIIAAGIPVLGVVVNGVKGQDQAYGSYAYSYNYPGRQDPAPDAVDVS